MTTLREAAQQALEALKSCSAVPHWPALQPTITALRDALAQQEQEPVAWMVYTEDGKSAYVTDNPHDLVGAYKAFALYTHPPRREWQRLTNEEMYGLYRRAGLEAYYPRDGVVQGDYDMRIDAYARAVEAKIKEKNNG
jgi:hypothetical protein